MLPGMEGEDVAPQQRKKKQSSSHSEDGRGRFIAVVEIADRWRIDDEWWRKEISRMYFRVALAGGRVLTVFQDLIEGSWFLQTTATPRSSAEPMEVLAPRVTATTGPAAEPAKPAAPIRRIGPA